MTSIAHIPRMMGGLAWSVIAERSEWEPFGDGVEDLGAEAESGDRSGAWTREARPSMIDVKLELSRECVQK